MALVVAVLFGGVAAFVWAVWFCMMVQGAPPRVAVIGDYLPANFTPIFSAQAVVSAVLLTELPIYFALIIWTVALQDNAALLTPATRGFIQARTSTSAGGYVLLTPPQVVRPRCPHTVTFAVELNFGGGAIFPISPLFLTSAWTRVDGRTIALNMRDVPCFGMMADLTAGQLTLKNERCVNLLPVLTHELGHPCGLVHVPDASDLALMNSVLSERAAVPTRLNVSAFVAVLDRPVAGARPGELEFREAAGLRAPADWLFERGSSCHVR